MSAGWTDSAPAWVREMGEHGDYGRQYVLDPAMMERVANGSFRHALDVGCGEGRFCRMLKAVGVPAVGIDPTAPLVDVARERDPEGDYRVRRAEALDFPDATFDLVVSYLTLIDIPDMVRALAEMTRVLQPGGTLLIANLTSFNTAGPPDGWRTDADGASRFCIDNYLEPRAEWVSWRGIRVQNWHRPLSAYMTTLIDLGMRLRFFAEPEPRGGDPAAGVRYRRVPWFMIMEWRKPALPA